jgi:hypothetical protein
MVFVNIFMKKKDINNLHIFIEKTQTNYCVKKTTRSERTCKQEQQQILME